jgi:ketosteroid isomerase-like protein
MLRRIRSITKWFLPVLLLITFAAAQSHDQDLLKAREKVWRAWFEGDADTLQAMVPPDTIVMSVSDEKWRHQQDVLAASAKFHAEGGKLVRLEFPRTEVQHYGDVAIIWSSYLAETETAGKRSIDAGRVTEIFVRRNGHWTNPGWHTDAGK